MRTREGVVGEEGGGKSRGIETHITQGFSKVRPTDPFMLDKQTAPRNPKLVYMVITL